MANAFNGFWVLKNRVGYEQVLKYNGVPEDKMEEAIKAEDTWCYSFAIDGTSFHMDHRIDATGFRLNFKAPIDGEWTSCRRE